MFWSGSNSNDNKRKTKGPKIVTTLNFKKIIQGHELNKTKINFYLYSRKTRGYKIINENI